MKYSAYDDNRASISVFVEKNGDKGSLFRVSLDMKNDGAGKDLIAQYHSYLDLPIDKSKGLVLVAGSNEWGNPAVISDPSDVVREKVTAGELRKVQLCKYIERSKDETNDGYHEKILEAVGTLIPYYKHVIGTPQEKDDEYWPSYEEYR